MVATNILAIFTTTVMSAILLAGCGGLERPEPEQIKTCAEDVKSSLNDPSSFEIVSTKTFTANDGTRRIVLKFTAKGLGGKAHSTAMCVLL